MYSMSLLDCPKRTLRHLSASLRIGAVALAAGTLPVAHAATSLADEPLFATSNAPGNLALVLSVEFPTAISVAHTSNTYSVASEYLGLFDPAKCYVYQKDVNETSTSDTKGSYFVPVGLTPTANSHICSGKWSGNFLNWATMQTIDPFRWVLTGGYRVVDRVGLTVTEKAWGSNQGSKSLNFPDRSVGSTKTPVSTPFGSATSFNMSVWSRGNKMRFTVPDSQGNIADLNLNQTAIPFDGDTSANGKVYEVFVRVKVCDPAAAAGGVEANCVAYGNNFKPEGLMQKYSNKIRYSAFGYLTDPNLRRDGGVLRAQQKFIGPRQPVPGSVPVANSKNEWDLSTGVLTLNPDAADAAGTAAVMGLPTGSEVQNSGVMNYLNKFGQETKTYKHYDNVSELYYAAIRYFKNAPYVPEWTSVTGASSAQRIQWTDGFPVITAPADPILYSCQRNFILGIGDVNTHGDKNVPENTNFTNEPALPPLVASDTSVRPYTFTNRLGVMEGLGSSLGSVSPYNGCCTNNSPVIAGLAYEAHIKDIRGRTVVAPEKPQTIDTYWVDVQEGQQYKNNNQFYLATKYGGFEVPNNFDPASTSPLPQAWWHTNPDTVGSNLRPDNYFSGGRPDLVKQGLDAAFSKIATSLSAFTTSFSTALPQVVATGNGNYSAQYDPANWSGELTASILAFDSTTGAPVTPLPTAWRFSDKLAAQVAGTGWDTNRRIVTWNPTLNGGNGGGAPFRVSGATPAAQVAATEKLQLDTSYVAGDDTLNFLNYLRGDTSNEVGSTAPGSTQAYRQRVRLVGDIVGSKARPVGSPRFPFSDATNPGYTAFRTANLNRRTVVYYGGNDGLLHAVNGALATSATTPPVETDVNAGEEMFAYVPRALFSGPNGNPTGSGLASLGNPTFSHHYLVNASPNIYDIDFARTYGGSGPDDWHSVLIGGLGKGGRSYYALDVTDPVSMAAGSESYVASKVLWEFSDPKLGFTYGDPVVVKTKKYGWVAIFVSGYNNADGKGYFLVVNPKTGALLEPPISTGTGSPSNDAGLAFANAFVLDATDGTADAVYAGDLLGNLWRLDVTNLTGNYPAPQKMAVLTDAVSGNPQPVTSRPSIEVHPRTQKRYVMVGTGRLLDTTDISSTQTQNFYVFVDGDNAAFTVNPVSPLVFPYTRAMLANNVDALTGLNFDPSLNAGWYEELGVDTGSASPPRAATGIAWRITADSTTLAGNVAFGATLPNGDVCTPSGDSRVYARDYSGGKSTVRILGTTTPTLFVQIRGNLSDLRYLSVGGTPTLVSGTDTGSVGKVEIAPLANLPLRRLNWRELQVVN